MITPTTPGPTWPKLLSLADYARACSTAVGKPVTRQAINQRLNSGTLTAVTQTIGDKPRRYIDTEQHPPGPTVGRHPNRPAGSVSVPRRKKATPPRESPASPPAPPRAGR